MEYVITLKVDGRVDVTVDAASFEEAALKARNVRFDPEDVEVVDTEPVCTVDENGNTQDF